ncbi:hypothetical protein AAW14_23210 [Streptomyces hygroscopicus]|nr:hypothetical protein [Streptomyces hygroscopicus]
MSATDPTMAITGRGVLRDVARFQVVEFTVATAPVASAVARAFDKPGSVPWSVSYRDSPSARVSGAR